jgi:toxin ParE1/3/4
MQDNYTKSKRADRDLKSIIIRGMTDFGEAQTDKYIAGLHDKMQLLAERPDIGREYVHSRTQLTYLCFPHESHMIYYRKRKDDIFITRILHVRMLPEKHI